MNRRFIIRTIQITLIALTVVAIAQELSKPKRERRWHGRVIGFIPYDFRFPTWERVKETYWNPYDTHVFTTPVFGVGWTINFYSLFENLGFIYPKDVSEESFLMPNKRLRQLMRSQTAISK
jgi:hypothetical protein